MPTKTVKCLDRAGTGRVVSEKLGLFARRYTACSTCGGTGKVTVLCRP
ncbi:molecular chaperone DnaJ [Nocardiopsis sp. ARC36]